MRRSDPQHVRHDRAGRPSSHDPIKAEWERRRENGEMLASGRQEAEALLAWFDRSYPKATRRPVSKTVRNWLARRFRPA